MNLILFGEGDCESPQEITLRDHRALHIQKILKLEVGAKLRIGRIGGKIGSGRLIDSGENLARLEILTLDTDPPPASRIELILALPRPKGLRRTLRAVANLGIKSVHLIHSSKVDKSYWGAPALSSPMMQQTLLEGLSIARDTEMPVVKLHKLFKPFAQDVAPHLIETAAYVAHPSNSDVAPIVSRGGSRIPVAIGPEGGFTEYEVQLLNDAGFQNLSLGKRLYSVETAVPIIESFFRFQYS